MKSIFEKESKKRQKNARISRLKEKKANFKELLNMKVENLNKKLKKKFIGVKNQPIIKEIQKKFYLKMKFFKKKRK
jgi:hypothetical protein